MKVIFLILFLSLFTFNLPLGTSGDRSIKNIRKEIPEYKLVFEDEFDWDLPGKANWTFEKGFKRNEELQWYQEDNAYCKDGLLIIKGRREQLPNPDFNPQSNDWCESREFAAYTSSSVHTRGLHSWQFGRFEIKVKIEVSEGMWPAIWMLGVEGEWLSNGEIDIMEYYSGLILANFVWGTKRRFTPK